MRIVLLPLFLLLACLAAPSGEDAPADAAPPAGAEALERLPLSGLDPDQMRVLRQGAEAGDAGLQCLYGLALVSGSGGRRNLQEGREWLRRSAEAGHERGGFEYGRMLYHEGDGPEDAAESVKWLTPAAENGNFEAAFYLGTALLSDEDGAQNPEEGVRWLRVAAESGMAMAQADLGLAHYVGLGGLAPDYAEAERWLTLAAQKGNGDACNKLGVMHLQGMGVDADPRLAVLWFAMGANLGDASSQFNLANCYLAGDWVEQDFIQAARWLEQAAIRGSVEARYLLGCLYADGLGVGRDAGRAREWLSLAERGGSAEAGELLEYLYDADDATPLSRPEPLRVRAGDLLRGVDNAPIEAIDAGRLVVLEIDEGVAVTAGDAPDSVYLAAPGFPGMLHCRAPEGQTLADVGPGSVLRGFGAGFTGLPGFLRLVDVVVVEEPAGEE